MPDGGANYFSMLFYFRPQTIFNRKYSVQKNNYLYKPSERDSPWYGANPSKLPFPYVVMLTVFCVLTPEAQSVSLLVPRLGCFAVNMSVISTRISCKKIVFFIHGGYTHETCCNAWIKYETYFVYWLYATDEEMWHKFPSSPMWILLIYTIRKLTVN